MSEAKSPSPSHFSKASKKAILVWAKLSLTVLRESCLVSLRRVRYI